MQKNFVVWFVTCISLFFNSIAIGEPEKESLPQATPAASTPISDSPQQLSEHNSYLIGLGLFPVVRARFDGEKKSGQESSASANLTAAYALNDKLLVGASISSASTLFKKTATDLALEGASKINLTSTTTMFGPEIIYFPFGSELFVNVAFFYGAFIESYSYESKDYSTTIKGYGTDFNLGYTLLEETNFHLAINGGFSLQKYDSSKVKNLNYLKLGLYFFYY